MKKAILFLDGIPQGKTLFIETVKKEKIWVWNLNFRNLLSMISHKLFWDGNRNENYYTFIEELEKLSNTHFNSENIYINFMINKFVQNEKPQLLIIHNGKPDLFKEVKEKFENTLRVVIADYNEVGQDVILNYKNDTFVQEVLNLAKSMLEETKEENAK